jgi:hypothetical protein
LLVGLSEHSMWRRTVTSEPPTLTGQAAQAALNNL